MARDKNLECLVHQLEVIGVDNDLHRISLFFPVNQINKLRLAIHFTFTFFMELELPAVWAIQLFVECHGVPRFVFALRELNVRFQINVRNCSKQYIHIVEELVVLVKIFNEAGEHFYSDSEKVVRL